ncbi:MAG: alpha,alpha-trehalose-phosphate synthase (UDP-forming) [Candidatus Methylomirabilia bacterium]
MALALLAYAIVPLVDNMTLRWFVRDLDMRSRMIATTLHEPLARYLEQQDRAGVLALMLRTIQDDRLMALAYCNGDGRLLYRTPTFPASLGCPDPVSSDDRPSSLARLPQGAVHIATHPVQIAGGRPGLLVLVHDMSFAERRSADTRRYVILLFLVLGIVVSLITVLVAHLSWHGWMTGVRMLLHGGGILRQPGSPAANSELQPLVGDLRALLRSLDDERRFADDTTITWSPDALRKLLREQLVGERIIVVSNREPYLHVRDGERIVVHRPASGLVTAVEPVMRACSGTWIAHGSGSADRETVDKFDRVGVPPGKPEYSLRRIWLTPEEETGYYYGFANEGLWPLCHIAHVRPIFRSVDWRHYVEVNRRFADAVVREADSEDPVVLVQDYHFALLPAMIRADLPRATIITFWHIPWPNPESFGICPWREELLQGLLGSTILGFHTRLHCRNFLETTDRYLETRIDHESSTIAHRGLLTMVESYPISIQWPPARQDALPPATQTRSEILDELALPADQLLGIGVDRLDYTKGIPERFMAVERMLELHPRLAGRFTFVQIAAPSRSGLEEYRNFAVRVQSQADRVNQRFGADGRPAIILRVAHHEPDEINRYYRAGDVCMVTSLHDGMTLVAKEFVAARDDERGALVLSQFTGAARELHEALIVNPYDVEQTATALHRALTMPQAEQRERMRSMRALLRDFNVYRWAGRMLLDAARVRRQEKLAARIRHAS